MITIEKTLDIDLVHHLVRFKTDVKTHYYLIMRDNHIVGVYQLQELTKVTALIHMHILPEYQAKGIANESFNTFLKLLEGNKRITKLVATIAATNKYMRKAIDKTDFKCCGMISEGIIYNNQYDDLIIFELKVK